MSLSLLLVEPDAALADALAADLARFGHRVAHAATAPAALSAVDGERHDALLIGWEVPEPDGIALVRALREGGLTVPILLLTTRARVPDRIEGLAAGADDYVVRPVGGDELDARIGAVLRGRIWGAGGSDTLRAGDIRVSPARFRAWRGERAIELAGIEFDLLAELVRHADTVLTRAALRERVWRREEPTTTNIVDAYISRLRARLTARGEADPIVTKRGIGYMLRSG